MTTVPDSVAQKAPQNIADQLRRDEGVRKFPYQDTEGKITIGVGRNLTSEGVSDSEITTMLANDIAIVRSQLSVNLPFYVSLDQVRAMVLVNMAFNLGFHGLLEFRDALACMEKADWEGAAKAILDSDWAKQVGSRAQRLALQLTTGEWQ